MKVKFTRTMTYVVDDVEDVREAKHYFNSLANGIDDYVEHTLYEDEEVSFTDPTISVWVEDEDEDDATYCLTDKGRDYANFINGDRDYFSDSDYDEHGNRLEATNDEIEDLFFGDEDEDFFIGEDEGDEGEDFFIGGDEVNDVENDFYDYITK